jgi:hypothetical protein
MTKQQQRIKQYFIDMQNLAELFFVSRSRLPQTFNDLDGAVVGVLELRFHPGVVANRPQTEKHPMFRVGITQDRLRQKR